MTWGIKINPQCIKNLKKFLKAANLNNLLVIPAGEAFDHGNKFHPEINLYTSDNRHLQKRAPTLPQVLYLRLSLGAELRAI